MGNLKRVYISIIRRKRKTIIIFSISFIIGITVIGNIFIKKMIEQTSSQLKSSISAEVKIEYPIYEEGMLRKADLEKIGAYPEVAYYDYTETIRLSSELIKYGENQLQGFGQDKITLTGVHYAPVLGVTDGTERLVDGRVFTEQEIETGASVAIISELFMSVNNLQVGDWITFENKMESSIIPENSVLLASQKIVLEVIGVVAINEIKLMDEEQTNKIYVPIDIIEKELTDYDQVLSKHSSTYSLLGITYTPMFRLKSIDNFDSFTTSIEGELSANAKIITNENYAKEILWPIKSLDSLLLILIVISMFSIIVILSIIMFLFTRERNKEFGMYLALGEGKIKLVFQLLVEFLLIVSTAFLLSLLISYAFSEKIFNILIENQLIAASKTAIISQPELLISTIESMDVSLKLNEIITIYLYGLAITTCSIIIPSVYIVRMRPQKILFRSD